jgi:hypothetical protein
MLGYSVAELQKVLVVWDKVPYRLMLDARFRNCPSYHLRQLNPQETTKQADHEVQTYLYQNPFLLPATLVAFTIG